MAPNEGVSDIFRWYGDSIRLRSLLKAMTSDDSEETVSDSIMNDQISLARKLIDHLHRNLERLKLQMISEQDIMSLNILFEHLEKRTNDAVKHVSGKLSSIEAVNDSDQRLIDYIFKDVIPFDDDVEESSSHESIEQQYHPVSMSIDSSSKPNLKSTEEIQLHQEDVIEEEIAQMASQLKKSSIAIKSTLISQNRQLAEMEFITQANLDHTKDITDKVTDEVKRRWRQTASRWFVMLIVFGTWCFCFLTIRMIPKRKNACLLFCKTNIKKDEHTGAEGKKFIKNQKLNSADYSKQKPPMYSFCKENGKVCTQPMDPDMHLKNMEQVSSHPAEDFAFELVDQLKSERESEHFDRAQQERNGAASIRVTEGWTSQNDEEEFYSDESNVIDDLNCLLHRSDEDEDIKSSSLDDMIYAAVNNEYFTLRKILKFHPEWATIPDENGWQAAHEAAYNGSLDTLRILIEEFDVDVNARTGNLNGSLLWWASQKFEANHPIIMYLKEVGATSIPPAVSSESLDSTEL